MIVVALVQPLRDLVSSSSSTLPLLIESKEGGWNGCQHQQCLQHMLSELNSQRITVYICRVYVTLNILEEPCFFFGSYVT